jgi:hypothetical protein
LLLALDYISVITLRDASIVRDCDYWNPLISIAASQPRNAVS